MQLNALRYKNSTVKLFWTFITVSKYLKYNENGAKPPRSFFVNCFCHETVSNRNFRNRYCCSRSRSRCLRVRVPRRGRQYTNRWGWRSKAQKTRPNCRSNYSCALSCYSKRKTNRKSKNPNGCRSRNYCWNNTYCTSFSTRQKTARHYILWRTAYFGEI